jgi:penicillin-binding protein 1C
MHGITGVTGAAPVLHDIFVHLHEQRGTSWFEPPPGLRQFAVHPLTGRRVPPDRAGAVVENCISEPEAERPSDYDADGRVVLSRDYAAWAASPQNFLDDLVTCAAPSQLRILAPAPGTIFFFDPDVPAVAQRVPLKAEATGPVEWSSDLVAADDGAAIRVELREGVHIISARDRASGRVAQTWIDVRSL